MPIIWVAGGYSGVAAGTYSSLNVAAALAAAAWVIAAGVAYWFGDDEPTPVVDVIYYLDPDPSWACESHPVGGCYGPEWGCNPSA